MKNAECSIPFRNGKRQGILSQDALALLGGMVSSRKTLVKETGGGAEREYKGKTIRGIDRPKNG